jgi:hypothetical protein
MNDEEAISSSPIIQAQPLSFLSGLKRTTRRIKPLVIPYMAPLFLVYVSEYTINQVFNLTLPCLSLGRDTNASISPFSNAVRFDSRCVSNLSNTLPTGGIHISFLFKFHTDTQYLSPFNYSILHSCLPNISISIRFNPIYLPLIYHYLLRRNFGRAGICQCIS